MQHFACNNTVPTCPLDHLSIVLIACSRWILQIKLPFYLRMSKLEMDIDPHSLVMYTNVQYLRLGHARRQKGQHVLPPFYADKHRQQREGDWKNKPTHVLLPKGLLFAKSFQDLGCGTTNFPSLYVVAIRALTLISNSITSKGWWLPPPSSER